MQTNRKTLILLIYKVIYTQTTFLFFLTLKTKHSVNIVKMGIGWLLLTSH